MSEEEKPPQHLSEKRKAKLFPEHLRPFVPWRSELADENLPLTQSGFTPEGEIHPEFTRLSQLKKKIEKESEKRTEKGLSPVNIVGIHASADTDVASAVLLEQLLTTPERLGVKTKILSTDDSDGNISPQKINEIVEAVKKADGVIITTHTKRGTLNSRCMMIQEALEAVDLQGKSFYFAHTFDDPDRDSQLRPEYSISQFFQEKGCIAPPYPLYLHTEGLNEAWVTRDIERSGTNLVRLLSRFSDSQFRQLVEKPKQAEKRVDHRDLTPAWKSLRRKVEKLNREREQVGENPINAVFVFGGENPDGYSATTAANLADNFNYLGVKTDWVHLYRSYIAPTGGDPTVTLAQEIPEADWKIPPGSTEEAYLKMLGADIIIFVTPVRWFEIAGRLQQFIERTVVLENQSFLLEGKAFGTVITFGEAGAPDAQARLERYARDNGMMIIPYGGVNVRLGAEPSENPEYVLNSTKGKKSQLRRMAAIGTALVTDILATDGGKMAKIRWDHLNPLLPMVSAED